MKNKIKKINFMFLVITIFQILLLINMAVANSYIIHQTNSLIENSKIIKEKNKFKNLIGKGINFVVGFLSIKQIGIVSATEISWHCCLETGQNFLSNEPEKCEGESISGECELGCCFDSSEGLCTPKSTKQKCENEEGKWKEGEDCLTQNCQKGCCILGSNTQFVTEKRCGLLSSLYGFENPDFKQQIKTEPECLGFVESLIKGACVLDDKRCIFSTETECKKLFGRFFSGLLCSANELGTSCQKQTSISCVEGKDEIYWFDSCGNKENIYEGGSQTAKDRSWNNGKILSKIESCNAGSSNAGSPTCGNCDYPESKCSETKIGETHVADGNYICKNINCGGKQNGESWCVYDSLIGNGKDPVGSRHWKMMCVEGETKVEPCSDYRGQLCSESTVDKFSMASCIVNEASECVTYNPMQELEEGNDDEKDKMVDIQENIDKCNKNKHCMIKEVNLTRDGDDGENDNFAFKMCVPQYPKGGNLGDGLDDNLCSIANQECKVVYQKNFWGTWECIANCDCEKDKFAQQMNDICISLGDCGSYINHVGGGSNNIKIKGEKGFALDSDGKEEKDEESQCEGLTEDKGAGEEDCAIINTPSISWENYKENWKSMTNQNVELNIEEFLASTGKFKMINGEISDDTAKKLFEYAGSISGSLGVAISFVSGGDFILFTAPKLLPGLAPFATAFTAVSLGTLAGYVITKIFGIGGAAATVIIISGGTTGLLIALGKLNIISASFGWISLGIAIAIVIFTLITGWGDAETRIVSFECLPWQAPLGGEDCNLCNGDLLKPCTKYRCESLGQLCKLINENTENPACISLPSDNSAPKISPNQIITKGYKFQNAEEKRVEIRKENGECIQEFTSVSFKLNTDEYAQCKWSLKQPTSPSYENMESSEYPLELNDFTKTHTFILDEIPSIYSLDSNDITGDLKKWYGNMNIYLKCQDGQNPPNYNTDEYIVNFCVNSGPDLTAIDHIWTVTGPKNNGFLKYNSTESPLTIWVNEPAECRYDIVEGKNYDEMKPMECKTELKNKELYGWPCSTLLTNLDDGENKFYIKCKDKPWVTDENIGEYKERNVNQQDFVYTLYVSESELKIDSVNFETLGHSVNSGGAISIGGVSYTSVDMKVKTSGGAENGKASCFWGISEKSALFENTFSNIHNQILTPRFEGTYENYIECEDEAGNKANTTAQFTISIDFSPPEIVRVYNEGNNLKVITNEQAECYYGFDGCGFNMKNAISMTTAFSTEHKANWEIGKTYYIKCKDIWGNANNECAIKIKPSLNN